MSSHLFATVRVAATIVIAAGLWQPVRAADATAQRRDEARLVLMEEHVEAIAAAARELDSLNTARQAAQALIVQAAIDKHVDAFGDIVTDYFLARRIKPLSSADKQQSQAKYLQEVSLLHQMIALANRCQQGGAREASQALLPLIEEFRAALIGDGKPAVTPAEGSPEKQAEPRQADRVDGSAGQTGAGDASPDQGDIQLTEGEKQLFKIINAYRAKQGLEPLRLDEQLCLAARDHSTDMKKHNFFSHQSPVPGRTRFTDRAENRNSTARAENIARDCKDPIMAMKLWVNSQHHRENITGPYRRVGIGIDAQGFYTQVFGR